MLSTKIAYCYDKKVMGSKEILIQSKIY